MHSSEERMKRIRKLIRDNNQVEVCKAMEVEVCKAMVVEVCKVMVEVAMVVVKAEVATAVVKVEVIMAEVVECHQTGLILEVSSNSHILMQDHQTPIQ